MKKWFKHDSFQQQHLLATKAKIRRSDRNFCHSARLKSATFEQALKIVTNLLGFYQLFRYFWGARGGRNFWPIDDFWPMMSYEYSCAIICIYDTRIWKYDQKLEKLPPKNSSKMCIFLGEKFHVLCAICVHIILMCLTVRKIKTTDNFLSFKVSNVSLAQKLMILWPSKVTWPKYRVTL